jgi:hypothetical protein
MKLTGNVVSDDLGADAVLEKAGNVLVVFVPLLEPEVELSGGDGVESSELQGKIGGDGRGSGQGQEGGDVGSDLEGNLGSEGDFHDGGGPGGRRVGGSGAKPGGERVGSVGGSGVRRVDGDGRNLGDGREGRGVEGGDRHGRHRGDASCSWLTGRWWREEAVGGRCELSTIKDRTAPAGRAPGLPTFFSDGAESGDVDITILINGHLQELLGERDHGGKRFGERGAGQEDVPGSLEESQLVNVGEAGEEEGQPRGGGGRDESDGDERVGGKSDNQGGFNGGQVDPETVDLNEIVGGRHYKRGRKSKG